MESGRMGDDFSRVKRDSGEGPIHKTNDTVNTIHRGEEISQTGHKQRRRKIISE